MLLFLLVLCVVFVPLSGCGSGAYKMDMDFVYLMEGDIASLDPQISKLGTEKTVISMIFEGLCRLDSTGSAVPGAAKDWESNEDFTRFTFHIREDATWSNGEPLLAEDFVFGIRRAVLPDTKATGLECMFIIKNAREINSGEADIETLGVYAPDSYTVIFELNESYERFPKLTANPRYMPCQQKYFEETVGHYGMDCMYIMTNGPFTFPSNYSWTKGELLRLTKTLEYTGEREVMPKGISLILPSYPDDIKSPVEALVSEQLDFVRLPIGDVDKAKENNCDVITVSDSVYGLLMNTQNSKLESAKLRGIYLKAIDRNEVISRMGEDLSEAKGIMPKSVRWEGKIYQQPGDMMYPKQKKNIGDDIPLVLEELDITELPSINIICPDDEYSKHLANGIIVSWNENLPNMFNLEPLSTEEYRERVKSGNYEAALYKFSANGTMPISVFSQFSSIASPQLLGDETYDEKLKFLEFSTYAYKELEQELINQYVFYPIHNTQSYYGINPKARDIDFLPDSGPDFISAVKRDS